MRRRLWGIPADLRVPVRARDAPDVPCRRSGGFKRRMKSGVSGLPSENAKGEAKHESAGGPCCVPSGSGAAGAGIPLPGEASPELRRLLAVNPLHGRGKAAPPADRRSGRPLPPISLPRLRPAWKRLPSASASACGLAPWAASGSSNSSRTFRMPPLPCSPRRRPCRLQGSAQEPSRLRNRRLRRLFRRRPCAFAMPQAQGGTPAPAGRRRPLLPLERHGQARRQPCPQLRHRQRTRLLGALAQGPCPALRRGTPPRRSPALARLRQRVGLSAGATPHWHVRPFPLQCLTHAPEAARSRRSCRSRL